MSQKLLILLIASSMLLLGACNSKTESAKDHDHDHGEHADHDHGHDHDAEGMASKLSTEPIEGGQAVELGCASCMFDLEGAEGCETAVKVGDKVLMLSGFELDAHKSGLCKATKKAEVAGSIDGDNFVASAVRLLPEAAAEPAAAE